IPASQCQLPVHQSHRQHGLTRTLQQTFDDGALRKRHGLLRQVEALDLRTVLLGPIHIGREGHEALVHVHAANTGVAAHCGIEYLNGCHDGTPWSGMTVDLYLAMTQADNVGSSMRVAAMTPARTSRSSGITS